MFSASMFRRLFSPMISGLRHVFYKPITIKYPYEKTNAVPEENYRFDPKQGIAYPGYKGRHILYLDKCTGCGTCDRTCENIAEAITMVFGYKIYIKIQKQLYENFKNDPKLTEALGKILEPFKGNLKTIRTEEEYYLIDLTDEPVFNYRCEVVYENLLENPIEDLKKEGWIVELSDYKSPEIMKFKISRDSLVLELAVEKIDFGFKQNRRSIFPAIDYGRCLPPWTPVFVIDGVKPIQEIKVGDLVLTHRGRFKRVTHVFKRNYTGPLYTFRTLGNVEPLTVTEEHPILTYVTGTIKWAFPREINYRTYLVRPIPLENLQLEKLTYYHEQYHPAGGGGFFTLIYNELSPSPDLMRLIGYYIAEGTADRYRVSFDISKEEHDIAKEIITLSENIFKEKVSIKPDPRSHGLKLVIDSVKVASFFKQFGMRSDQKRLPDWALLMPITFQREFVKAIYLGDGHYSNKYYSYTHSNRFVIRTTSRILANQLLYILARLGIVASISLQKQKGRKDCYSIKVHTPFITKMASVVGVSANDNNSRSHNYIKIVGDRMIISPVVDVHVDYVYNFTVYNLEVEEDQSFVASNQIVHNCVFCGFCVDACPFNSIEMTPIHELSVFEREELLYNPLMLSTKRFETYPPETNWAEKTVILMRRYK